MKSKVKIIAEIAQGFEGDLKQSKLFIKAASSAEANAVKFQLVYADELATADYQYYSLFKELEMEEAQWKLLKYYASSLGTQLIVDVFEGPSNLNNSNKISKNEKIDPIIDSSFKFIELSTKFSTIEKKQFWNTSFFWLLFCLPIILLVVLIILKEIFLNSEKDKKSLTQRRNERLARKFLSSAKKKD